MRRASGGAGAPGARPAPRSRAARRARRRAAPRSPSSSFRSDSRCTSAHSRNAPADDQALELLRRSRSGSRRRRARRVAAGAWCATPRRSAADRAREARGTPSSCRCPRAPPPRTGCRARARSLLPPEHVLLGEARGDRLGIDRREDHVIAVGHDDRARAAALGGVDELAAARTPPRAAASSAPTAGETIATTRDATTRLP